MHSPHHSLSQKILDDECINQVLAMGYDLLKSGMNAGSVYDEVWIRDLNTFIEPLLDVTPAETVRKALITFFHFQGDDGDIVDGYVPLSLSQENYRFRFSNTCPHLKAHKNTVETDQESSLVQAVCRYLRVSKNFSLLDEKVNGISISQRLDMALEYPLTHRLAKDYGLIWGGTTADWGDVQPEHVWGVELDEHSHRAINIYNNALLCIAIDECLRTSCFSESLERKWSERRRQLHDAIRKHLWDDQRQKFIPHLYIESSPFPESFDESQIYYHGGTAVAIEAGLLTPDEVLTAYTAMCNNVRLAGAASIGLTVYPPYPEGFFKNPAMKPYSYQNGGDWTWFGARMISQLVRYGYAEEAYEALVPMLNRVINDGDFYEWHSLNNEPRGSARFRGSAGVLIQAIKDLQCFCRGI